MELDESTWRDLKGKRQDYAALFAFFQHEVGELGVARAIAAYLPEFSDSIPTGAFHCLIQTGFGVCAGNATAVASGLAYFAFVFDDLVAVADDAAPFCADDATLSPARVFESVHADAELDHAFDGMVVTGSTFSAGMKWLHEKPDVCAQLNRHADRWRPSVTDIPLLAKTLIHLFYATGGTGFFTLHTLTALFALRQCLPLLSPTACVRLLRSFLRSVLYAYAILGRPAISYDLDLPSDGDWSALVSRAIDSNDEHIPKIIFVSRLFAQLDCHDDPHTASLYHTCAQLTLDRISTPTSWNFAM